MNFLENLSVVWQRLSLVQRAMLLAILVAGGITAVFLTKWASKPDMRPLYSGVSPEDAGKISEKITEKGIVFELRGTGNIYVPKEYVYQLRADLAKDGLPGSDSPGYTLFDKGGIAVSPFMNDVNFTRALQDEIARSIQLFDTITSARVHIVRPEQNVFQGSEDNSTASVVLQVKPGFKIGQSTVAAITHMVAGSVEGLTSDGVTLVDSQGNLLSNPNQDGMASMISGVMGFRAETEQRLAAEVQEMLEAALGPGRSKVMVSAEVDMNNEVTEVLTYDKGIVKLSEIEETVETTGGGNDAEGNPITPDEKSTQKITEESNVPMTTTKKTKMAGEIKSISVAVIVDLTVTPPPVEAKEGEEAPPPAAPVKIMQVEDVKELMLTGLGKNKLTAENLTVKDVAFNRPTIPAPVKEPWHLAYVGMVKQGSLGIMAICALLALKIFSGKVKPSRGGGAIAQLGSGGEGAIAALPAGDMREQISLAYKSDPDQVKELFTSWIEEKG